MRTFKTKDTFELMVLLYLELTYPRYTDEKLFIDNNNVELTDEEYNDAFFQLVDDVREKFLDKEGADETIANQIVEHYMSDKPLEDAQPKEYYFLFGESICRVYHESLDFDDVINEAKNSSDFSISKFIEGEHPESVIEASSGWNGYAMITKEEYEKLELVIEESD